VGWRGNQGLISFRKPRSAVVQSAGSATDRFYQCEEMTMSKEIFDRGLAIRKKVLGAEFVEKSFASADDFNRPMQELTTEYCWGAVWGRELPHKIRSMLNLAMISCLNRPHELKMHVKGALKNGVTKDEIREVFLQVAIYAGIPAGVDSFRIAREAFAEVEKGA
jgi:4-carboxymuconolactone decarboxylase